MPQQQNKSLRVKDLMYDDSLSLERVNYCSRSDIWHHGKKWLDRSILRKLVA
jgi:hypothetical protein